MKNKRRIILVVAILVSGMLLLTACGSDLLQMSMGNQYG